MRTQMFVTVATLALCACASGSAPRATSPSSPPVTIGINPPTQTPGVQGNSQSFPVSATGGANFSGGTQAISGTAFPLLEDTVAALTAGGSPEVQEFTVSGGATLTAKSSGYELSIPALGIDTVLPGDGTSAAVTVKTASFGSSTGNLTLGVELHKYLAGGAWTFVATDPQAEVLAIVSPFVTGYVTPQSAMPLSGTANYVASGGLSGFVFVRTSAGVGATLSGDVSLSGDFSTGLITGAATNIVATDKNGTSSWNDLTLNATIQTSVVNSRLLPTSSFSGTTGPATAPGTAYALESNAKGQIGGNFFGPNLDEIGAVWSLGSSDSSGAAYGVIGADLSGGTVPSPGDQYLSLLFPNNWTFGGNTTGVPTPLPATRDNGSTLAIFATPGGPTLDRSSGTPLFNQNGSPTNIVFPVWMTALEFTSVSILPVANSTGAYLSLFSALGTILSTIDLSVPSLGVQDSIAFPSGDPNPASPAKGTTFSVEDGTLVNFGLSYAGFGAWLNVAETASAQTSAGYFSYGFETPLSAMPTTGTATYSQAGGVGGTAFVPSGNGVVAATVSGDANLTTNFATGAVTGNFTNTSAYNSGAFTPWNNVSVNASIAAGSNMFSGSTAATSAPAGNFALKANAAGHINGSFYGPNANELGAVWTLSNGDGTGSAIGVVGARKQ